ncbi:tyrosine-type recombinase/integrase [Granulicella paludicola]|uniref:tyrosine-type recombinase/integrase n=1 Tax=Granulicella paludicola TaxID=474951 RepID=UPI0021DFFDC1|nr:tyrosine-type recombinase/integrase [Granulicella paludicola]
MKLQHGIQRYIDDKRAAGLNFSADSEWLASFIRHVGDIACGSVSLQQVVTFLESPRKSPSTWERKRYLLARLSRFLVLNEISEPFPLPAPRRPPPRKVFPYIYTQGEIRQLLSAAVEAECPSKGVCLAAGHVMRTYLLLLYGTGISVSEGRNLIRSDIDFKLKTLVIRNSRGKPSRKIPFGLDLCLILSSYDRIYNSKLSEKGGRFFNGQGGQRLNRYHFERCFRNLCLTAKITRRDGTPSPLKMRYLRDSFAVHRLTTWIKKGVDLNRMIPALSAYMGFVWLGGSARYLRFTPEYYRSQLNKLRPDGGKQPWRIDPRTVDFLLNI